jgi:hypothetical protein
MRPVFSFRLALIATAAPALAALAPVAAEPLSACGETPEAARAAFAKFISVEVKDVTTQEMARERATGTRPAWLRMLIGGGETTDTSTRLTVTSEQTTEVNLSGVRVEPTGQSDCPHRASIEPPSSGPPCSSGPARIWQRLPATNSKPSRHRQIARRGSNG